MKNRMTLRKGLWGAGLLLLLSVSIGAYGFTRTGERADCPGKVVCPLTGEEVCKDQCPLSVSIETSIEASASEDDLPPCCRGKK